MDPALFLAAQIGVFQLLINFNQPILSLIAWGLLLGGAAVQYILLQKAARPLHWLLPVLTMLALVVCEIACMLTSGWDIFIWVVGYGYSFIALVGILLAQLLHKIRHNQKSASP